MSNSVPHISLQPAEQSAVSPAANQAELSRLARQLGCLVLPYPPADPFGCWPPLRERRTIEQEFFETLRRLPRAPRETCAYEAAPELYVLRLATRFRRVIEASVHLSTPERRLRFVAAAKAFLRSAPSQARREAGPATAGKAFALTREIVNALDPWYTRSLDWRLWWIEPRLTAAAKARLCGLLDTMAACANPFSWLAPEPLQTVAECHSEEQLRILTTVLRDVIRLEPVWPDNTDR